MRELTPFSFVLVGQDRGTEDAGGSLARDGLPNSASVASAEKSRHSIRHSVGVVLWVRCSPERNGVEEV